MKKKHTDSRLSAGADEGRWQAEMIAESEKHFSDTMIESMPGILYFYNDQGQFLRWNRNFEIVSGYSGAEIARMHPLDFFPGEEKPSIKRRISEVFETGESFVEAPLLAKDGKVTPYFFTGRRVVFNGVPCLVGVGIDISERKQTENLLVESEQKYRELVEHANSIILRWNADGCVTFLNEFGQRVFGYTSEEILGRHVLDTIVPPTESSGRDLQRLMEQICADPKAFEQNINENMRRDGKRLWIAWTNRIVLDAEGRMVEILSVGTDITERRAIEEEINFKSRILQTQQEASLDAILVVGENEQILSFNRQFIDLWRLPPQMVKAGLDAPVLKFNADQVEDRDAFVARIQYLYEHRNDKSSDELKLKDGRIIDRYSAPITGENGKYLGRVWYFRDITERRETETRIAYLNRVYAMLSGINTLIVRVRDREELFREACRVAIEAGGFRMALLAIMDAGAKQLVSCVSAGMDDELQAAIRTILSSNGGMQSVLIARAFKEKQAVVSNDTLNDSRVLFGSQFAASGVRSLVVLPLVISGDAIGVITLYASEIEFFHGEEMRLLTELAGDISFAIDHIDKQERLNFLAYYDELTGLANRTLFLERVAQFMRSAEGAGNRLALFLFDLERFKNINDSLGRPAGDVLLKQVAEWLKNKAGGTDLLARVDADQFALVMPEVRQDGDMARLIEKTLTHFLEHSFPLNDTMLRISAKIGVALYPDDGSDAETLFNNAEAALKMAKKSGDRYLFHTKKMTEAVADKLTLENQLRVALENEEFVLHYQPKVNFESGKVAGAEALIRWNDPRTGLVPPGKFIPILEETGLIYDVGRWALRKAIEDYLRWRAAGLPVVRIAVNVSPLQLRNPGFVAEIEQKISVDAHAAQGLELEITESMIMEDVMRSISSLRTIRGMGVSVAIDDFGTGFSSLGYLSKLPVDTLKIDRSFVIDITAGPEGLALVSTIITLAHALKLKAVAEGVETEEQARLLRLLSCDEMQGYLFSKPVPADIFEAKFLVPQ